MRRTRAILGLVTLCVGCSVGKRAGDRTVTGTSLDAVAEGYVKVVLAVDPHVEGYVDAYYGPPEWRAEALAHPLGVAQIRERAEALLGAIDSVPVSDEELVALRRQYLQTQLRSLLARVSLLEGQKMTFDEESRALYDAVAPSHPPEHFQRLRDELEPLLPGPGSLIDRYEAFRNQYVIPNDRLDTVFRAAIDACRERTLRHTDLPPGESFVLEYVTGQSWSGYNWYKGGYHSLIQINTDLPIHIDRAIDLACHEGYPGHHVYNALLEQQLVRNRGWVEFSVYPLFSPQSLIAEGTANYGIEITFPDKERVEFEERTLFPLAGLDGTKAALYYTIQEKVSLLRYAENEAARRYIDGEIDARTAADELTHLALMPRAKAEKRVRFIDTYRSYVINYNLGEDLVRRYIESRAGGDRERAWDAFVELLSSPRLPSGLLPEN